MDWQEFLIVLGKIITVGFNQRIIKPLFKGL
jgi:hypothetical protein